MPKDTLRMDEWVTIAIIAILLILFVLFGCSCNAKNIEYRRWDSQGNQIENVRMGQINLIYWFKLNDLTVRSDPMNVNVGEIEERNDPNSVKLLTEILEVMDGIPL